MADRVEALGVDLRTRVKRLGAKEKARRKQCKVRFSLIKKNKAFQKSCMKEGSRSCCERVWCQQERGECMQWGWLPRKGKKLTRQMAAAARKKGTTSLSLFHGGFSVWRWRKISPLRPPSNGQKGCGIGKWPVEQKEACMNQTPEVQTRRRQFQQARCAKPGMSASSGRFGMP